MLVSVRRVPLALRLRLIAPTTSISHLPLVSSLSASKNTPTASQWTSRSALSRAFCTSQRLTLPPQAAQAEKIDDQPAVDSLPLSTFTELKDRGLANPVIIDTITKRMKIDKMTDVQSLTIAEALTGVDVLAQAKTGTGKTLAFLLPIIQRLLASDPALANPRMRRRFSVNNTRALIISPTRELAEQICIEAKRLTSQTSLKVQLAVGGTQKRFALNTMHREGCHILIGTPGRLKDLFSDPGARVSAPELDTFVLDEADRMLDDGFWPDVEAIRKLLPDPMEKDRQTLMFSATVPRDVAQFARSLMKKNLHYVQTVREDDVPTHQLVEQRLVVVPSLEYSMPAVLELCAREIQQLREQGDDKKNFKALIYFNTTAEVELYSQMLENITDRRFRPSDPEFARSIGLHTLPLLNIHSRLTQPQRTRAAETFRNTNSAILLSSDVTARGMDFPNVTHVIQVGLSKDGRDSYIHRVGRTGRAGKDGQAWLIIPSETVPRVRKAVEGMPLQRDQSLKTPTVRFNEPGQEDLSGPDTKFFQLLQDGARTCSRAVMAAAYQSFIGANGGWWRDRTELAEQMNRLSRIQWGMSQPPWISANAAQASGFTNIPGVNIMGSERRERNYAPRNLPGSDAFSDFDGMDGYRGNNSKKFDGMDRGRGSNSNRFNRNSQQKQTPRRGRW